MSVVTHLEMRRITKHLYIKNRIRNPTNYHNCFKINRHENTHDDEDESDVETGEDFHCLNMSFHFSNLSQSRDTREFCKKKEENIIQMNLALRET